MATVNVDRATATLWSPAFLKSTVLIVVGSLLAQVVIGPSESLLAPPHRCLR